jgi:hypothetical protein
LYVVDSNRQTQNFPEKQAVQPPSSTTKPKKLYTATISEAEKVLISNNPIFSQTRSKPEIFVEPEFIEPEAKILEEIVEVEPIKSPTLPPNFQINGLIQQDGRASILVSQQSLEAWKSIGDKIGEWKISKISKTAVTLTLGVEKFTMRMPH